VGSPPVKVLFSTGALYTCHNGTWGISGGGGGGGIGGGGTLGFIPKFTPDGTTLGNSALDEGVTRIDADTLTNKVFNVSIASTSPANLTNQSWYSEITMAPVGAWTGTAEFTTNMWVEQQADFDASSGTINQSNGYFETISNGDTTPIEAMTGLYSEIQTNGTAPVDFTYGIAAFNGNYGGTIGHLTGADLEGYSEHGTVTSGVGTDSIYTQAGNGTTTTGIGVRGYLELGDTGAITTGYEFLARTPVFDSGTSQITNLYGIYIEDMKPSAQVTNAYQLYSAGAAPTYFHSATFQLDNLTGHGSSGLVGADASGNLSIYAKTTSTNHAICWKSATTLGFCSTIVAADGSCTCN